SDLPDADFCRWLTERVGVAAIPLSAFEPDGRQRGVVRFCFAKQEATLDAALKRLAAL
ncbi:MAG: methionine aminotransferase, partial [Thiomonas sp.]